MSNTSKTASSQAAWALITEGVTQSRLEAHRLRHLSNRALKLVQSSDQREHLYQAAGDIITALPERLAALEQVIDRTALVLSKMGENFLEARLPLSEKQLVNETLSPAFGGGMTRSSEPAAQRLADVWFERQADLDPALGLPSRAGPCHVVERIEAEVGSPATRDYLQEKAENGQGITNPEARMVYKPLKERGAGLFRRMILTSHAQYRMDLRGITVGDIQAALKEFSKKLNDWKSQQSHEYAHAMMAIRRGEPIEFLYKVWDLFVVFTVPDKGEARIITVYWKGMPDPKAPGVCILPHSHDHGTQRVAQAYSSKQ